MENKENVFNLECGCGGGEILQFKQTTHDGIVYIHYVIPAFNAYQRGFLWRVQRAFGIFFCVLFGREYSLYDIEITNNDKLEELKNFVARMKWMDE